MAAIELSATTDAGFRAVAPKGLEVDRNVVWLRGEHDLSTSHADSATLAKAIALDDSDLWVDLSEVRFMDGSTVRTLVNAHAFLRGRSRSMTLRAPSPCAALVIRVTGLDAVMGVQAAPQGA